MEEVVRLHIKSLPNTFSSKLGFGFVHFLYRLVNFFGKVQTIKREGRVVAVMSSFCCVILTLAVDAQWQRRGLGRELVESLPGMLFVYTQASSLGFYRKLRFEQLLKIGKTIVLWRKK